VAGGVAVGRYVNCHTDFLTSFITDSELKLQSKMDGVQREAAPH
jgi:hypothetical protein